MTQVLFYTSIVVLLRRAFFIDTIISGIMLQLKLDPDSMNRRATFVENGLNVLNVNTTANTVESCLEYDANVQYSLEDVYRPIDIEMHYQLLNPMPESESGEF